MDGRGAGAEHAVGLLSSNPFEEGLEQRGVAEQIDGAVLAGQAGVVEGGVELLVTGLAHGHAVLGFAAFLLGQKVVLGDQLAGHMALAERTSDVGEEIGHRRQGIISAAPAEDTWHSRCGGRVRNFT